MLYNRDYAMLLRTGRRITKERFKKEWESACIVMATAALAGGVLILAILVK